MSDIEIAELGGETFVDWLDARDEAKRDLSLGALGAGVRLAIANDHLDRMISGERDE